MTKSDTIHIIIIIIINSQSIKVVSAIIVADGKLLLLQRDDNIKIKDPGCWQLPGGGVENDEVPDDAIKRELQEEIGVVPSSLRFLISPTIDVRAYYAKLNNEETKKIKKGTEGKDLRFFSFSELSQIPLTQKLTNVIKSQEEILKSLLE